MYVCISGSLLICNYPSFFFEPICILVIGEEVCEKLVEKEMTLIKRESFFFSFYNLLIN